MAKQVIFFSSSRCTSAGSLLRVDEGDEDRALFIASITSSAGGCTARTTSASPTSALRSAMKATSLNARIGQLDGVARARLHVQLRAQLDQLGQRRTAPAPRAVRAAVFPSERRR